MGTTLCFTRRCVMNKTLCHKPGKKREEWADVLLCAEEETRTNEKEKEGRNLALHENTYTVPDNCIKKNILLLP